jgi:NAD(P)-dependent dehydrogenase (short-subunit alcohol dehydrogenase family)
MTPMSDEPRAEGPDDATLEPLLEEILEEDDEDRAPVLALITGGARRLGARLTRALAEEGYDIAISYHSGEAEAYELVDDLLATGVEAAAFGADLRQPAEAQALIESVESDLGPIGLLVNNAGILLPADVDRASAEDLDRSYELNVRAPYVLSLEVGRRMRARGEGAIVNIASVGGLRPYRRHLSYSVTKAGLVMLTQALAAALAPEVTVNAIAPGTVWLGEDDDTTGKPAPGRIPLGDWGRAEDVEDALVYLASAPYVTGQILAVDGGWHLPR